MTNLILYLRVLVTQVNRSMVGDLHLPVHSRKNAYIMCLHKKYDFALKLFTVTSKNKAIQAEQFLTLNLMIGFSGWRGFPKRSLSASSSINSTCEGESEIQFHFVLLQIPEHFKYNLKHIQLQEELSK